MVAGLWSFIEGELQVEPDMARHGYDDDDFDIVDADGWNQYDSCNEKSTPTTSNPYDAADDREGRPCIWWTNQYLIVFEDAFDDWCDITELEPEKTWTSFA